MFTSLQKALACSKNKEEAAKALRAYSITALLPPAFLFWNLIIGGTFLNRLSTNNNWLENKNNLRYCDSEGQTCLWNRCNTKDLWLLGLENLRVFLTANCTQLSGRTELQTVFLNSPENKFLFPLYLLCEWKISLFHNPKFVVNNYS